MKTRLLIACIVTLLLSGKLLAQDWALLGNTGTNPTTNFLGTTDFNDLRFRTNNIVRGTILSNGNWGIGPGFTAPASMLHLHNGIFGTFTQFTNGGTGALIGDGFRIGL